MFTNKQHTYGPVFKTRLDLMGIRFMTNAGDGSGAGGGDAAAQAAAAAAAAQAGTKPPWGDDPTKFDPDKAWALIQNVKGDLAEQKTKTEAAITAAAEKAQKDTLAQFARLLSGAEEPETDPAKLAAKVTDLSTQVQAKDGELTKAQADLKAANLSTAVALVAPELGANTKLLLSNEEFKTSIASAEPTDEAAIKAAITKALQANAALKQPPARSGDVAPTGPTVQSLEALLAQAEKDRDVATSIMLKRRIADAKAKL